MLITVILLSFCIIYRLFIATGGRLFAFLHHFNYYYFVIFNIICYISHFTATSAAIFASIPFHKSHTNDPKRCLTAWHFDGFICICTTHTPTRSVNLKKHTQHAKCICMRVRTLQTRLGSKQAF